MNLNSFLIVLNSLFLLGLGFAVFSFALKLKALVARDEEAALKDQENIHKIQSEIQNGLLRTTGEISLFISKSTAEMRAEQQEKLNEKFNLIGKDLRSDLMRMTEALEKKFATLELKVSTRLEEIGKEVQIKLDKNIQEGFSHFQKVQEMLAGAEKQLVGLNAVGQSIQDLNNVLNLPHLRGKLIGEGNLERLLADFLPQGFFEKQYSIEGNLVDFVIKFPHINLVLPIDCKFTLEQVSALFERSGDPIELKAARKRLSEISKQNAKDIKNKYIKPKLGTTDYALMFLPSETLYFEVIRDTDLWNALTEMKVFPVSPNTIAITINSIGKSLQYYEMAKGVQKTIHQIHLARDHLLDFKKRFDDIGDKLIRAQDSFQKANTHFSNYSSSVGKLVSKELGTDTDIAITEIAAVIPAPIPPV